MAYATDDAIDQVLSRLGEVASSRIAELPDGAGPAAAPTVTTADQILAFLTEGCRELVRRGVFELYGGGTYSPAVGAQRVLYTSLTMDTAGQRMWRPLSATWNAVAIDVCERRWYEVHNRTILADANSTPERVYPDQDAVLLAPKPSASQQLRLNGIVLPRDQASGQSIYDVPDHLVPAAIVWAAMRTAGKIGGKSADIRAIYDDLEGQWSAFLGQGAG